MLPDGRRALTGSSDNTARLWDLETGKELRRLVGHTSVVTSVAVLPDGRRALTGSWDHTARLWDLETGQELRSLVGHSAVVSSVAVLADGRRALTGSDDNTARLWDLETGKELRSLVGHTNDVMCVAALPDSRRALTGSADNTARLWDLEEGRELCSLISFNDGTWAVTDPEGRYDASNDGDVEGLHWVVGMEPIALKQLKARYYDPGLLAKHMGFNKEPLRRVDAFSQIRLYPRVAVAPPARGTTLARVTLANQGGGIGRVVVKVNGKEVLADARGPRPNPNLSSLSLSLDLSRYRTLMEPGKPNTIEVAAFNGDGTVISRGTKVVFTPPAAAAPAPPKVWALVAGISDYRGDRLDLRYAAADAERFAGALRLAVAGLKLPLELRLLSAPVGSGAEKDPLKRPGKAGLTAVLREFKAKAKPADLLVLYLAGHGVSVGGDIGDYYYLTESAADAELRDPQARVQDALSGRELGTMLIGIPALKQVVILDTCASGRGLQRLAEGRDVSGLVKRSWADLRDRSGIFLLAGCASDAVSYEASRFGQGLLTYSLLEGLQGPAVEGDGTVRVQRWLEQAARRVPELAREIRGIQQPVLSNRRDAVSFPIGRLTEEDRKRIPVARLRHVLVRPRFNQVGERIDPLRLEERVAEQLREAETRGTTAAAVFWDVADAPDAYQITGEYRITGDSVTVDLQLYRDGKRQGDPFRITGKSGAIDALTVELLRAAQARLPGS